MGTVLHKGRLLVRLVRSQAPRAFAEGEAVEQIGKVGRVCPEALATLSGPTATLAVDRDAVLDGHALDNLVRRRGWTAVALTGQSVKRRAGHVGEAFRQVLSVDTIGRALLVSVVAIYLPPAANGNALGTTLAAVEIRSDRDRIVVQRKVRDMWAAWRRTAAEWSIL